MMKVEISTRALMKCVTPVYNICCKFKENLPLQLMASTIAISRLTQSELELDFWIYDT